MREEIMALKKEIAELREQSFAMEVYQDSKRTNKRMCYSFTIILSCFVIVYFITVALFLAYINGLGVEETVVDTQLQEITGVDTIEGSNIVNGDYNEFYKAN